MSDRALRDLQRQIHELQMDSTRWSRMGRMGALPTIATNTTSGGGTDEGGGCCCNEFDCIKPIPGIDEPLIPRYRLVPVGAFCGCSGGREDGEIRMYQVDPDDTSVWESPHGDDTDHPGEALECSYPDCTATSTWRWPADATVTDTPGEAWVLVDTQSPSCGTPLKPDYDGPVGEEATADTEFRPTPQPAWWRETILGKDGNGCDQSKLEFFIGEEDEGDDE